ncbi:hypothetical protein ZHAS_00007742 [Anopheles sinensis]|uniref:Uncharacterized protein n=1 Tax=Anopheles sinensis TaxID=74873 RepID=A0A084VQW6_ANOSI|nr:hypothetical protein ZHAS_00007742 [Anopheles sinensis]
MMSSNNARYALLMNAAHDITRCSAASMHKPSHNRALDFNAYADDDHANNGCRESFPGEGWMFKALIDMQRKAPRDSFILCPTPSSPLPSPTVHQTTRVL